MAIKIIIIAKIVLQSLKNYNYQDFIIINKIITAIKTIS